MEVNKVDQDVSQWCPVTGQWAQIEMHEIALKCKKKSSLLPGCQEVGHVARRSCGVSSLGDTQNPTRFVPEQPAVIDPAVGREAGLDKVQRCLPASSIL